MHQIKTKVFSSTEILNCKGKIEATGAWIHVNALNSSPTAMLVVSMTGTNKFHRPVVTTVPGFTDVFVSAAMVAPVHYRFFNWEFPSWALV